MKHKSPLILYLHVMNHLNNANAIITIDIVIIESPQPLNVVPLCKTIDPNGVALVKFAPS